MPDFSEFADEAKNLASDHADIADKGIDEAGQLADDKTGGKFDSEVGDAEQKAEDYLGTDNQGAQDPPAGNS